MRHVGLLGAFGGLGGLLVAHELERLRDRVRRAAMARTNRRVHDQHKRALGFRLIGGCDDVSDGGNLSLGIGKAGENRLLEKKKGRCSTDP